MPDPPRRSPVHHLLLDDSPSRHTPRRIHDSESRATELIDLSFISKIGVKGKAAEKWLGDQNVEIPLQVYHSRRLTDGGHIVRLATDEFLLESGETGEVVLALKAGVASPPEGVTLLDREEATFFLSGLRALDVLAQTCGVNFRQVAAHWLVLTRVAGASCGVFVDPHEENFACRLWIDYTLAPYLWETLSGICAELDNQ